MYMILYAAQYNHKSPCGQCEITLRQKFCPCKIHHSHPRIVKIGWRGKREGHKKKSE